MPTDNAGNTEARTGLGAALEMHAQGVAEGLALAGLDCVLLDGNGKVALVTPGFLKQCGEELGLRNGALCSDDPAVQARLASVARFARGAPSSGLPPSFIVRRNNGRRPLLVRIALLPETGSRLRGGPRPILIIVALDGEGFLTGKALKSLFPLSEAEAEVAILLAQGLSVADIAAARRVTRETVRGQLKNVFRKMDLNRQADLVRIIDRLSRSTGP